MTQNDQNRNWLEHALAKAPWRTQQQTGSLALAVVVIVAVIGALYLAQASRTAAAGRKLQALEAQRQALEQQNAQLRAEIAALRSVPRLIDEAERLGFHQADVNDVEYLRFRGIPAPETVARSSELLPTETQEIVPTYEETLEIWLTERTATFRERFGDFWRSTFGRPEE